MPSFESYRFAEAPPPEQAPSEPEQNLSRLHTPDQPPSQERRELRDLVEKEVGALKRFVGYDIEVPPLPVSVTPERLKAWREKGMDLHYLPPEDLRQERKLPGYWILIERREKQSRLGFSWEDLHLPGFKETIGRLLDVPPESVRRARAAELDYLANAFGERHCPLHPEESQTDDRNRGTTSEPHRETCRPPFLVILSPTGESARLT